MNPTAPRHLSNTELLTALVERGDLDAESREHLAACPACGQRVETLAGDLRHLGTLARRSAPVGRRPQTQPPSVAQRPLWAAPRRAVVWGLAAAVLLLVILKPPGSLRTSPSVPKTVASSAAADERLLTEVDRLIEDALPAAYGQLVTVPFADEDQAWVDTLVPDSFDPPLTTRTRKHGGVFTC